MPSRTRREGPPYALRFTGDSVCARGLVRALRRNEEPRDEGPVMIFVLDETVVLMTRAL